MGRKVCVASGNNGKCSFSVAPHTLYFQKVCIAGYLPATDPSYSWRASYIPAAVLSSFPPNPPAVFRVRQLAVPHHLTQPPLCKNTQRWLCDVLTVRWLVHTGMWRVLVRDMLSRTYQYCLVIIAVSWKTNTFAIEELKRTQDRLSDMQNPR